MSLVRLRHPLQTGLRCLTKSNACVNANPLKCCIRQMGDGPKKFRMIGPTLMDKVFYDQTHLYVAAAVLPLGLFTLYLNIVEGPAELAEIPEGYEPEPHEYYKNPIERFMAKYVYPTPEKNYEINCHYLFMVQENEKMRLQQELVSEHMESNNDFKGWYYTPVATNRINNTIAYVDHPRKKY